MKSSSNNFLAGVFTIVGIVGFVFIILTLSGVSAFTQSRTKYIVQFELTDGARGLKNGSDVAVGGQSVGEVKKVRFSPSMEAPTAVDVEVAINSKVSLYEGAVVYQMKPLLGDVSAIDIPNVGNTKGHRFTEGEIIKGQVAPPSFLAQAGYGDKQKAEMQKMLENGAKVSEDIKKITEGIGDQVKPTMDAVSGAAKDVKDVTADVKAKMTEWSPRIENTLKNVEQLSKESLATRALIDQGLEKAKAFIEKVQTLLADNTPHIENTLRNADELSTKLNNELYASVKVTMEDAQKGLKEFAAAGQRISNLVAEQAPELRLTLANARLASDQLKLTMTEVRRNPWRLLYQPGKKELERELLYDAARDYATAISDLRGASASLEAVAAAGCSPERMAEIQKAMQESFAKYKEAEGKFLDMVVRESR